MPSPPDTLPDWERLLAAERHVQHLVPGAVPVGSTAAPLPLPHFWLTALANLGEPVDWDSELPSYGESGV